MAIKTRVSLSQTTVFQPQTSPLLSIIALNSACELVNQPGFDSDVILGETQTRRRIESASVPEKANGRDADYSTKWFVIEPNHSQTMQFSFEEVAAPDPF